MIAALRRPTLVRALRYRPFAFLWTGQSLSRLGDHLYEVALAWWVLQVTHEATAMGLVLICNLVPTLIFLLIGGVAGDRLPRGRVMFAADVGRAILAAALAAQAATGTLILWQVCVAAFLFGTVDAFFGPAYAAVVPDLVPADDLPSANALTNLSQHLARVGGPALAAGLIAIGGTPFAFALNSVSFVLSACCLLPLLGLPAPLPSDDAESPGILRDLGTAFRTVLTQPWLWITIGVSAVGNVALAGPYSVSLPFLVQRDLGGDATLLGLLYACFPLGYIGAALVLGSRERLRWRGPWAYAGLIAAGLGLGVFGLHVPIAVLVVGALLNGVGLEIFNQVWTSLLQERVPGDQLARVTSVDMLGSFGLLPLGLAAAGLLTDAWGAAPVFLAGGGLTVTLALLGLAHPRIRQLD